LNDAGPLLIIAAAALGLPPLAARLRLPAVVLEILFGILVGPVAGLVQANELIVALGELGFLLLLFLAGFEIDLRLFERTGTRPIVRGAVLFGLTLGLAAVSSVLLGQGIFMALLLATTSVGLVVPTLRSDRSLSTPLGQDILMAALIADFATLVVVSLVALVLDVGADVQLLVFPLFLALVVASFAGLRAAAWWWPDRFSRFFHARDPDALGVRFAIAMLLGFAGLAAALGIEPVLGAFLAGTGVATVFRHRGELDHTLDGLAYGFLIPIFFIGVGLTFSLAAFQEVAAIGFVLVLVVVAFAIKLLPALVVLGGRHGIRSASAAGLLLSARLSLIIVVARIGVQLGVIAPELEAQIILLAALSATFAPIGYRLLAGAGRASAPGTGAASPTAASPTG
jgi:Kef-type K+ transport system membrane component KefB